MAFENTVHNSDCSCIFNNICSFRKIKRKKEKTMRPVIKVELPDKIVLYEECSEREALSHKHTLVFLYNNKAVKHFKLKDIKQTDSEGVYEIPEMA